MNEDGKSRKVPPTNAGRPSRRFRGSSFQNWRQDEQVRFQILGIRRFSSGRRCLWRPGTRRYRRDHETVQIFGTIDPAKISDYTDYMAAVNLYDGLVSVDSKGNLIPQLAES